MSMGRTMIMTRPKCAVPECTNGALVLYAGKLICGECLVKFMKHKEKQQWEELIDGCRKNTGN